ncbi:MAG: LytTR family DNA-binding domain-containing protein [Clostridiales bacterium]|nr:LytTR family DNA-binding domain-containing protein [Clostridiales bacterium]
MKIAVIDDERPARSELLYLLHVCQPDAEYLEASSGEQMLELLETEKPDLCFVDISLGSMNGTTLASLIKSKCPDTAIIFATAYQEYAVKAFELGAVDYLLKPFDLERVKIALGRAMEHGEKKNAAVPRNRIMVQGPNSMQVISVKDIVYIETENRICRIHTLKDCYEETESLGYYEKRLKEFDFFRIHKSFLINLAYVKELVPSYSNGYAVKLKGFEKNPLPVGRQQIKVLRHLFE